MRSGRYDSAMSTVADTAWGTRASSPRPVVRRVRLVLITWWLLLLVMVAVVGERPATLTELMDAVDSGQVSEVHVAGGLPAGATGSARQDIRWRQGLWLRHAEVVQASPGYEQQTGSDNPSGAVTSVDVAALIRGHDPAVRVAVSDVSSPGAGSVLGWGVPPWLSWCVLAGLILTLGLIVNGPEPWRATRWAWAWAVLFTGPIGALAFAVLSGPTSVVGAPRDGARRLRGGWAFLLMLILSSTIMNSH